MCIKSFKLVVHGGWCIDGNDNLVNTWRWWGWESKKTIFEEKKLMTFSWIIWTCGLIGQKKSKKTWISFRFEFEFWVNFANSPKDFQFFYSFIKNNNSLIVVLLASFYISTNFRNAV